MQVTRYSRPHLLLFHWSAGLLIAISISLSLLVVPLVISDTTPSASHEQSVIALLTISAVHLLLACGIFSTIRRLKKGRPVNKQLLVMTGILCIISSLILLDGAVAYQEHVNMKDVVTLMSAAVVADMASGFLILLARYKKV